MSEDLFLFFLSRIFYNHYNEEIDIHKIRGDVEMKESLLELIRKIGYASGFSIGWTIGLSKAWITVIRQINK
jgi:hypothetical protein